MALVDGPQLRRHEHGVGQAEVEVDLALGRLQRLEIAAEEVAPGHGGRAAGPVFDAELADGDELFIVELADDRFLVGKEAIERAHRDAAGLGNGHGGQLVDAVRFQKGVGGVQHLAPVALGARLDRLRARAQFGGGGAVKIVHWRTLVTRRAARVSLRASREPHRPCAP